MILYKTVTNKTQLLAKRTKLTERVRGLKKYNLKETDRKYKR